ncbi:TPA: hypothetical protein DCE37_23185 [Candidatus Latescibacteria bacterium]|nr:hypothetical protein [Candidatus Latescibacterota bacterium]|tara:strand:- start:237 stop:545 length:309 start_codon:yes stop_codon:yes gene_type:complete
MLFEDLLQGVLLKIHVNLPSLKDADLINGWIYMIARNVIVDHYRALSWVPNDADLEELYAEDAEEAREELKACARLILLRPHHRRMRPRRLLLPNSSQAVSS